jgi:hypothetical protein
MKAIVHGRFGPPEMLEPGKVDQPKDVAGSCWRADR